jgi:hypothetical protein
MAKEVVKNSFFSETVRTIGILISIVSTSIIIYARIDKIDDKVVRVEENQVSAQIENRDNYRHLSDSVSALSREVIKIKGQNYITREIIKEDPVMAEKLDRFTRIIEQISTDYEKKNSLTQLSLPSEN